LRVCNTKFNNETGSSRLRSDDIVITLGVTGRVPGRRVGVDAADNNNDAVLVVDTIPSE
jgi:hypothetical protein